MSNSKPISLCNLNRYVMLGLTIAYYRKLAGLTQKELADRAGISRSHLSAIEAPNIYRAFSLEILFLIADALKVPVSSFFEAPSVQMENRNQVSTF